jgi:hypothetical protein
VVWNFPDCTKVEIVVSATVLRFVLKVVEVRCEAVYSRFATPATSVDCEFFMANEIEVVHQATP